MAGKKNGVELAKAYVQIIPSMEGVQQNIEDALNGGGGVGDIGSKAGEKLGKGLTSAFTKAVGFLKDSLETGMGFDSAMSQVAATMGTTVDEITELRDKAKEMGAATNYSATQAAEGLNILAMSGYDAEHSMEMLEDVLHLAAAGGMEMSEAAGDISGAMKGFSDASKDSAYYADLMAKGATLANTSVSQLGQALSDGSAMGKAYSQSAEGMTVSLLRLAEQGEVGSGAATALAAAYANLYTPMDQAKEVMNKLGVEAYDPVTGKAREFNTVVNELNEAIQRESQGNEAIANQYKDLIFGKQGLNAYNKLVVTSIEKQEEWAQALAESTGAASQQYDTMTDNLAGDMDKMRSAFEGLQIEISEELSEDLRGLIQVATEGLTWLTDHSKAIIGVISGIGAAAVAMNLPAVFAAAKTAVLALNAALTASPLFGLSVVLGGLLAVSGVIDDMTEKINEIPDAFEGLDKGEVDFIKSVTEGTNDLAEAEQRLGEAEVRLKNLQTERDSTLANRKAAEEELLALKEKEYWTNEDWIRAEQLEYETIPQLTEKLNEQRAAVGEMAAAKMDAKAQVDALTEAQEQLAADTEAATIAEEEQAAAEEDLAAKKEAFAELLKESMKEAITANIELNDKTVRLSRDTAERMGEIIDSYDEMYAHQKQAIEGSFDLFDGFTADTSLTFDTLMKNLKDTSFYMNDWATAIEQLGKKGVSKGLLDELKSMGGDSWQIVYAMNHATQEQLDEYSSLWEKTQTQITTTTDRMMKAEKDNVEAELSALAGIPDTKIEEIKAAFEKAGYTGVKGYADSIRDHFDEAEKAVDDLVNKQLEKLKSDETITEFSEMGKNVYLGLAKGMNDPSVTTALDTAVEVIVNRVIKKTEEGFEIKSPSKVFDEMGVYIPEGLAGGVVRGTDSAEAAIQYMTDTVIDAAQDQLTGADLGLDLNVNALDRVVSSADYRSSAADYDGGYTAPERKTPATIVFELDSHEIARATFPDINELLGRTTALQARGYA